MKNRKWICAAGGVAMMLGTSATLAGKVVERIVARVNNEIVTEHQYEQEREKLRNQISQNASGQELDDQFREQSKNLLRDLIDQDLMVEKAKDLDIKVEADVVKREDDIRKNAHLDSIEALQNEVEKQGLIWEDFEDNIRRNLLMQEVIGHEVGSRIIITEAEKRKYYQDHKADFVYPEGVHLAEILVSTEKRKPEEADARAKEALAAVKAGDKWAEVTKKYSDHDSANDGGDIGFFKTGTLASPLEAAISKLGEGDNTDIIPTKYGEMILKVLQRRQQGMAKYEDVEQKIAEILYNQKMEPAMRDYLRTLRKESYIYLAAGYIDTGAERPSQVKLIGDQQDPSPSDNAASQEQETPAAGGRKLHLPGLHLPSLGLHRHGSEAP